MPLALHAFATPHVLHDDVNPYYDKCSGKKSTVAFGGTNIGDLLNARGGQDARLTEAQRGTDRSAAPREDGVAEDGIFAAIREQHVEGVPFFVEVEEPGNVAVYSTIGGNSSDLGKPCCGAADAPPANHRCGCAR